MLILGLVILFQIATHWFWLSISAHSGQVAIPYMMNHGMSLFGNLLEQHAPATSVIAALTQEVLPFSPIDTARLLNLVLVVAISIVVYLLATRIAGNRPSAGIIAVLFWACWEPVYGNVLFYFDTLLGFCLCLALLVWHQYHQRTPFFSGLLAGLLMGLATLAKQHGWVALLMFLGYILFTHRRSFFAYLGGALLFPLLAIVWVGINGDLDRYLYWNWQFNFSGLMDSAPLTGDLMRKLALSNLFVIPFALLVIRASRFSRSELLLLLLWGSATITLLPRFGIIHVMAHLPLAAVMAGVVSAQLDGNGLRQPISRWLGHLRTASVRDLSLIGVLSVLGVATILTSAVVYVPNTLGRAGIPGYDEFRPLVEQMEVLSASGDTLFVLPETDSTPQIHEMTGLLPPNTWIKGWRWYLEVPGINEQLLTEWRTNAPTWIIFFPDLISVGQPAIDPLVNWLEGNYHLVETVQAVTFHGDALIYRANAAPAQ